MQVSKLFYFVLILHLILEKVTKVIVEKLSTSEVISQKPLRGREIENTPQVSLRLISQLKLSGKRPKNCEKHRAFSMDKLSDLNFTHISDPIVRSFEKGRVQVSIGSS